MKASLNPPAGAARRGEGRLVTPAEARRHDRQAARDGDAELAAYNARLARLAEHEAKLASRSVSSKEPR